MASGSPSSTRSMTPAMARSIRASDTSRSRAARRSVFSASSSRMAQRSSETVPTEHPSRLPISCKLSPSTFSWNALNRRSWMVISRLSLVPPRLPPPLGRRRSGGRTLSSVIVFHRTVGPPLANLGPVVTVDPTPPTPIPWPLLAWAAPEPTDWVDHSRGTVEPAGQVGAGVLGGGALRGLARARRSRRRPVGARGGLASGLADSLPSARV